MSRLCFRAFSVKASRASNPALTARSDLFQFKIDGIFEEEWSSVENHVPIAEADDKGET